MTSLRNWGFGKEMAICHCGHLSLLFVLRCHVTQALLTMLTQGHLSIYNSGSRIELDCEFLMDDFTMFDNPIVWKKSQLEEAVQMNTMRSIHAPFLQTTRIGVQLTTASPRYRLLLTIENCTAEDSGNYTCEVRGKKSAVLDHVTHTIAVRAPVQKVYFTSDNQTFTDITGTMPATDPDTITPLRQVTVFEGRGHSLRCVALGGYPPPSMHVYVGEEDVTDGFLVSSSVALRGIRGLRLIVYRTEAVTDQLTATMDRNGEQVRCFATVPGLWSNVTTVTISVNYAPVISCRPTMASVGERDVSIRCEISARPDLLALFWIINANGSTVTQQRGIENFWSHVKVLHDGVTETQLSLKQVLPHHFRKYTLVAENSIDTTIESVELFPIYHSSSEYRNNRELVTNEPELSGPMIHLQNRHLDPPYGHAPSSMTLSVASSASIAPQVSAAAATCVSALWIALFLRLFLNIFEELSRL